MQISELLSGERDFVGELVEAAVVEEMGASEEKRDEAELEGVSVCRDETLLVLGKHDKSTHVANLRIAGER